MKALLPILAVSDLRHKPKDVFARLSENPIVLTLRGRPRAVLMDYDAYNEIAELQQTLE
jgi:prevent-host-death family protein